MQLLKLFFNSNHDVNLRHANSPVIQAAPWSDASIIRMRAPRTIPYKTLGRIPLIHHNTRLQFTTSRHCELDRGVTVYSLRLQPWITGEFTWIIANYFLTDELKIHHITHCSEITSESFWKFLKFWNESFWKFLKVSPKTSLISFDTKKHMKHNGVDWLGTPLRRKEKFLETFFDWFCE